MRKNDHEQFDDDQSRRLAEALRASAAIDPPAPSASLRDKVERKLNQQEERVMVRDKQTAAKRRNESLTRWWVMGVSLTLLLAMGTSVWLTHERHGVHIAAVTRQRASEIALREHTDELKRSVLIAWEEQHKPPLVQHGIREESQTAELLDLSFSQDSYGSQASAKGGYGVPSVTYYNGQQEFTAPDVTTALVQGAPAVPGGGTVLLGGIRRQAWYGNNAQVTYPNYAAGTVVTTANPRYAPSQSLPGFFSTASSGLPSVVNSINDVDANARGEQAGSAEEYDRIHENAFLPVKGEQAVSTFSIDVDTASYSNMRRFLTAGSLPPADAVRIEELVNYFHYDYPQPEGDAPFSANMELAGCPWNEKHQLLRVALKGKEIEPEKRPAANLVFLLDVSGSMSSYNKLPLVQSAMKLLVGELRKDDRVAIVVYAGAAGLVLDATAGDEALKIRDAIDRLKAGGSTNGAQGIVLAYEKALANFIDGGINRVVLATDGDLNVGVTEDEALVELIKEKASHDVFLTVLGFGTGNLKDTKLEKLADNGNGSYAYIDNLKEARKVLVEQIGGSLITIAKDVKLQLEFNPAEVRAYRLIGYENRILATKDFDDDTKDAGEIGAGHTVTALYELVPAGSDEKIPGIEEDEAKPQPLKYQETLSADEKKSEQPANDDKQTEAPRLTKAAKGGELLTLALRYKQPEGDVSTKLEFTLPAKSKAFNKASKDFQFAASVASFGMLLRHSQHAGDASFASVEEIATGALGEDTHGRRQEFVDLVQTAEKLSPRR